MSKKVEITPDRFNKFLKWLSAGSDDNEAAARKYESLHRRLVYIFLHRKAYPAEELADKTFDIVIQKIDDLIETYQGDPALYIYKVAGNVHFEFLRSPQSEELKDNFKTREPEQLKNVDKNYDCLSECLKTLSPDRRELILEYFENEKQEKINNHKELTEKMGITNQALRVKVFRIKKNLQKCVENCLKKGSM